MRVLPVKFCIGSHRQRCDGKVNRPNLCGHCGARYIRKESLQIHLLYCTENDQCGVTEMTKDDDLTKFVCKYIPEKPVFKKNRSLATNFLIDPLEMAWSCNICKTNNH